MPRPTPGIDSHDVGKTIASRIRKERRSKGWTQQELADRVSKERGGPFARATLGKIELGGTRAANLSIADFLAFVLVLDVSAADLFPGFEESEKKRKRRVTNEYWAAREAYEQLNNADCPHDLPPGMCIFCDGGEAPAHIVPAGSVVTPPSSIVK